MIYISSSSSKNTVHHYLKLSKIIPIHINVRISKLIKNINKPLCTMMQCLRAISHYINNAITGKLNNSLELITFNHCSHHNQDLEHSFYDKASTS